MSDSASGSVPTKPVTLVAASSGGGAWIACGDKYVDWPGNPDFHVYWFVVFSRKDMSIVANVASNSSSAVPSEIAKFAGDTDHILMLVTNSLTYTQVPTGALATFIADNGGGVQLRAAEQVAEQAGSAAGGHFTYALISVFGEPQPGFEAYSFWHKVVLAASVQQFGDYWTPVNRPA